MHEMSLCEGIVQILETGAQTHGYKSVKTVFLEIGPFSGVEIEALKFSFDVVTRGTLAEGSKLDIEECQAQGWCMECAKNVAIKERFDDCPLCSSAQIQVTSGDEMRIKELEVE